MILISPRRRRRMSLTPMIDVVFLLLIFFMLAARFGTDGALQVTAGSANTDISGPPRLLDVYPEKLRLNGIIVAESELLDELSRLAVSRDEALFLRSRASADVQRLIDVMEILTTAGFGALVLAE